MEKLPVELVRDILEHFQHQKPALAALARTCKLFYKIAKELLYERHKISLDPSRFWGGRAPNPRPVYIMSGAHDKLSFLQNATLVRYDDTSTYPRKESSF